MAAPREITAAELEGELFFYLIKSFSALKTSLPHVGGHLGKYVLKTRNTDRSIQTQKSWWFSLLKVKFIGFKLPFCLVQTRELNLDLLHPSEYFHCWVNVHACCSLLPHRKKKEKKKFPLDESNFPIKKMLYRKNLTSSWWDEGCSYINGWCCDCLAWPLAGHVTSPHHSFIKLKSLLLNKEIKSLLKIESIIPSPISCS